VAIATTLQSTTRNVLLIEATAYAAHAVKANFAGSA
jgi:hypothetical protein